MNWLPFIGFFLLFALFHSMFASRRLKRQLFGKYPAVRRYYRIGYNLISLMLLAIWLYVIPFENSLLYEIAMPLRLLFHTIQLLAFYGLYKTIKSFNSASFLGLEQMQQDRSTDIFDLDESSREALLQKGIYGRIRHPLYTFSMMLLFFHPVMTTKFALISLLCTLYFAIGSYFEEQRLIEKYGEEYRNYRKQTGRFIPRIKPSVG